MSPLKYTLNILPIEIDADAVLELGRQPYDDEVLRLLRQDKRNTHFFKRDGRTNQILSIALAKGVRPVGETITSESLAMNPWLVAPLVLDTLLRYFHAHDRPILKYRPLRIVTKATADDVLRANAPSGVSLPSWIERRVSYSFDTRIGYVGKSPQVLLACDVRIVNVISASCAELLQAGVPLEGLYVKIEGEKGDPRLAPRRYLAGRIARADGDSLELTDCREDDRSVDARSAFLEPTQMNLELCIRALFAHKAEDILLRANAKAAQARSGPDRLRRIRTMIHHLGKESLELAPGVPLKLGGLITNISDGWKPNSDLVDKPYLIFDPSGARTGKWNQGGLDQHGPYDQRNFSPKTLRIAVVCQQAVRGTVEQFVAKFLDGMPDVDVGWAGRSKIPYEKGFIRRYALLKPHVEVFPVTSPDAASYAHACRDAISAATDIAAPWNLALIQIDDVFHELHGDENPYLITKAMFMKAQVPVQEVTIEKMRSPDRDLVYIMNDISIATYAKIGGVPWLLKAKPVVAHELVIGLGSHEVRTSRFGPNERVVGITTIFSADGNYLLDNKTTAVPFESYGEAMLESVKSAVQTVKSEQNWRNSEAIRLIFHTFKPLRDAEVQAVTEVVTKLGHKNATFAFIHFATDHCYRVFDESNLGVRAKGGIKGEKAPPRGLRLQLSPQEWLLSFSGPNEIKKPEDGLPDPVLLKLHRSSSFKDMEYLSRQAFDFSCHSWRTFSPAHLPITILYSDLIARLLRGLEAVSSWDADAMLGHIGRTRWFL